jgi:hypothetical protein
MRIWLNQIRKILFILILISSYCAAFSAEAKHLIESRRISVLPIFFVPRGENQPTQQQKELLQKHLLIARERYNVMLKQRDTFSIAHVEPQIVAGKRQLSFYRKQTEKKNPPNYILSELLDYLKTDRHHCSYVLLIVVMNSHDLYPYGGGIPINAGTNTGGGYVELSSYRLDNGPGFQSTLQHELGHGFGLPHSDTYGFDMKNHISIMSYNDKHVWKGFTPPENQGILAPEDLRLLALNKLIFPDFYFSEEKDVPDGYKLPGTLICLYPPVKLPNKPDYKIKVTTSSGATAGTSISNLIPTLISKPDAFDDKAMWISGEADANGWVSLVVEFPNRETMNRIISCTQHGGKYNMAEAIRIEVFENNTYRSVIQKELKNPDELVEFPTASGSLWRLWFKAGESRKVTIRGLEFFDGNVQLYPQLWPYSL